MDTAKKPFNKKLYFSLLGLCLLGSIAVLPYAISISDIKELASPWGILLIAILQSLIVFGLLLYFGFKLVNKTDLKPFDAKFTNQANLILSIAIGIVSGIIIILLDKTVFADSALANVKPPIWMGALASIYGAINEEVILRLFFFTLLYFLCGKIFRFSPQNRLSFLWVTNILVALLFGLGHLPAILGHTDLNLFELSRILLLNGIPGLLFGWLYFTRSIWAAMTAHFVADILIHVVVAAL